MENVREKQDSKKMIAELNSIRSDVQDVLFKIKQFQKYDIANQCQKNIINTLDDISKIQKNIISEDILAEKGEGELALYKYIKAAKRAPNSYRAMSKVKDICQKIPYQELLDIAEVWADAALKLTNKDLRMMERLIARQSSKFVQK